MTLYEKNIYFYGHAGALAGIEDSPHRIFEDMSAFVRDGKVASAVHASG
jgi:hypothetical protein